MIKHKIIVVEESFRRTAAHCSCGKWASTGPHDKVIGNFNRHRTNALSDERKSRAVKRVKYT
jgi:hypothetical protein